MALVDLRRWQRLLLEGLAQVGLVVKQTGLLKRQPFNALRIRNCISNNGRDLCFIIKRSQNIRHTVKD